MRNCTSCQSELPENARFCPQCGEKVFEETLACPDCGAENAPDAKFCFHCGIQFFSEKPEPESEQLELNLEPESKSDTGQKPKPDIIFEINTDPQPELNDLFEETPIEDLEKEIFEKFTTAFRERIEAEHNSDKYKKYVDRFNESGFKKGFDYRVKQLAEEIRLLRETGQNEKGEAVLHNSFEESLDYFIIHYCPHLNDIELPETILKYQNTPLENIDLAQMILDYLDFENEDETVYLDFIKMPLSKLKNAGKTFLFPEKDEKILFICDQSVLGSCKEGFAMTEKGLYWKMHFEKADKVMYADLNEIKREEDWITVNGKFFNINRTLNLKMLKLLKKLKRMVNQA